MKRKKTFVGILFAALSVTLGAAIYHITDFSKSISTTYGYLYSLTLDSSNSPILNNGHGEKHIGFSTFEYHNAGDLSNGHVTLYEGGYIEKDAAKGLNSFVCNFTGNITVQTGFTSNDYCYTYTPLDNELIQISGNYIKITSNSLTNVVSLTISYSCIQDANETHSYSNDWNYDDSYHWHNCLEEHCSSKTNVEPHNFVVDTENSYPPSNGKYGVDVLTCNVCGAHYEKKYTYETVGVWTQNDIVNTVNATKNAWSNTIATVENSTLFAEDSPYRQLDAKAAVSFYLTGYLKYSLPKLDFTQYSEVYMRFSANGRSEEASNLSRRLRTTTYETGTLYGNVGTGTTITNYTELKFLPDGTLYNDGTRLSTAALTTNQLNGTDSFIIDSISTGWPTATCLYASDFFIKKYIDDSSKIDQSPIDIDLSEETYTFDIPQNIDIESIYWNETYLGDNRTINTSSFGNAFGDDENIYVNYVSGGDAYVAIIPVTLCTKILRTVNDVNNFLALADAVNGVIDDNIYNGHFILGNDIDFNNGEYVIPMHGIPNQDGQSDYGFAGTFDGRGYSISNIEIKIPGWVESTDRVAGFISRLTKTGVLKNTAFINIKALYSASIVGWGEGVCENLYIKYAPYSVDSSYFGTFNNSQGSRRRGGVTVKNCLIDGSELVAGGTNIHHLLGDQFEERYNYQGVYSILPNSDFPLLRKCDKRETSQVTFTSSSLSYDIANGYLSMSDLLRDCQDDVLTWDYFHRDYSGLYFGEHLITTANPSNDVSTHNFIDDYVVVCDKEDIESVKAASLIVEHLYKASSTEVTYTKKSATSPEFYRDYTGGKNIKKVGNINYSSNKNLIVVGNKKLENELSLSTDNSRFITVDNSIFLLSKESKDYLATAVEFLNQCIGMTALNDNVLYYDSIPNTLPNFDFEFDVTMPVRNRINYISDYNYNTFGFNGVSSVHEFTNGPLDDNGKVAPLHNSIYWLPLDQYQSTHPKWYRQDGTVDVCYTAHGDSDEFAMMVEQTAINMRNALIAKPSDTKLTFTLQDIDYYGCSCSACQSEHSTYADDGAGSAINFLNKVAEKIIELDSQNGIINREFTLYIFGYYFMLKAPSNISMNEHVGVIIAPIKYSYEAYSIYDSVNDSTRSEIEKWCSLTKNIAFWFYCVTFNNYFSFIDVFESLLSWVEYIYTLTNGNVTYAYMQGASVNHQITGFQTFKQYIYSRAFIELMNKVKSRNEYASIDSYKTAIRNYLTELENEYFGISYRSATALTSSNYETVINGYTFTNNGFYGNSDANKYMYELYMYERFVYQDMLSRQVKTTNSDVNGKLAGRVSDRYDYVVHSSSAGVYTSSTANLGIDFFNNTANSCKYYYCPNYTTTILNKMMGYYENAIDALSNYEHAAIEIYRQNVIIESLYPRFFICMANTTKNGYGYYNGYNGTSLQTMRQNLKVDCQAVGYNYFAESITINYLYSKWGI